MIFHRIPHFLPFNQVLEDSRYAAPQEQEELVKIPHRYSPGSHGNCMDWCGYTTPIIEVAEDIDRGAGFNTR